MITRITAGEGVSGIISAYLIKDFEETGGIGKKTDDGKNHVIDKPGIRMAGIFVIGTNIGTTTAMGIGIVEEMIFGMTTGTAEGMTIVTKTGIGDETTIETMIGTRIEVAEGMMTGTTIEVVEEVDEEAEEGKYVSPS
jgi:hypothetical protein